MSSDLIQLIYVSSASHLLSQEELLSILESSVRHNKPQEVTGMLLYAGGSFMQVLEGPEEAVQETMRRIRADARHKDVSVLYYDPVEKRDFDTWSMGFYALTALDATNWPDYAPLFRDGFDPARIGARPSLALEMLKQFSVQNCA